MDRLDFPLADYSLPPIQNFIIMTIVELFH